MCMCYQNVKQYKYSENIYGQIQNDGFVIKPFSCRKCPECLLMRSREWVLRCHFEAKMCNDVGEFITLTYADSPTVLIKSHLQKFIKRYRKLCKCKIKYFACGEYGKETARPHYHILIFGHKLDDYRFMEKSKKGHAIYHSMKLSKLWKYGRCTVQPMANELFAYCTTYTMKSLNVEVNGVKQFNLMSQGIGLGYFMSNVDKELKNWINNGYLIKGVSYSIPLYYWSKFFGLNELIIDKFSNGLRFLTKCCASHLRHLLFRFGIRDFKREMIQKFEKFRRAGVTNLYDLLIQKNRKKRLTSRMACGTL